MKKGSLKQQQDEIIWKEKLKPPELTEGISAINGTTDKPEDLESFNCSEMATGSLTVSSSTLDKVAKAKATIELYYSTLIAQTKERKERFVPT